VCGLLGRNRRLRGLMERPVVVITGALSGIGAATALEFAAAGARLVLADRVVDNGREMVRRIEAAGGEAVVAAVDVRDYAQVERLAPLALERWGQIDVLVANAGVADQSSMDSGDVRHWRTVLETNLLGTLHAVRAVLPHMLERRGGHIFITASVSGREAYAGEPVYIASKWGQVGLAHSLRMEVMEAGIRVTLVEPGIVDTPLTRDNPLVRPLLEAVEPLAPEDVARAILFAYNQPEHVVLSELTIRPVRQALPTFGDQPH
jgi:NADP-dependent 3-hydroxy acid dehydrogenase YdfG